MQVNEKAFYEQVNQLLEAKKLEECEAFVKEEIAKAQMQLMDLPVCMSCAGAHEAMVDWTITRNQNLAMMHNELARVLMVREKYQECAEELQNVLKLLENAGMASTDAYKAIQTKLQKVTELA